MRMTSSLRTYAKLFQQGAATQAVQVVRPGAATQLGRFCVSPALSPGAKAAACLILLLLSGCEKATDPGANKGATTPTTLQQENQAIAERLAEQKAALDSSTQRERALAERKQHIDSLHDISKRWVEAVGLAGRTGRSDLAGPIAKMEAIKSELEGLAMDTCASEGRSLLLSAINTGLEAYKQFQQQTGAANEALVEKLGESSKLVADSQQALNACAAQSIS